MQTRTRIRLEALEAIKKALEAVPKNQNEEVTKVEAIRILVPQIHAMRGKGYSLNAIATMLSEQGIPVTGVALRSYLRHARARKRGKPREASKKKEATPLVPTGEEKSSSPVRAPSLGKREEKRELVPPPAVTPVQRSAATEPKDGSKDGAKQSAAATEKKPTFEPKADSEEI